MKGSFSGRGLPPPVMAKSGSVSIRHLRLKNINLVTDYKICLADGGFVVQ